MKRYVFIFSISLFFLTHVMAQTGRALSISKLPLLKETTTLVVLDDSASDYNEILQSAIESHWKITPYKFIHQAELEEYMAVKGYSLLVKNNAQRVERRVRGDVVIQFNEIGLYLNNKSALENFTSIDALARIRVKDIEAPENYTYKLGALLQSMHQYLEFIDRDDVNKNNYPKKSTQYFNAQHDRLKDLTLLINQKDLSEAFEELDSLESVYKHSIKVVSCQEIQEAIQNKREDIAFLHLYPNIAQIQVIAAHNAEIMYSFPAERYKRFSPKDLSNISNAANGKLRKKLWRQMLRS